MARKSIRVFYSTLSGRFYASAHYREEEDRVVITGKKYDVTNDIGAAVVKHDLEFSRDAGQAAPARQPETPTGGVAKPASPDRTQSKQGCDSDSLSGLADSPEPDEIEGWAYEGWGGMSTIEITVGHYHAGMVPVYVRIRPRDEEVA